MDTGALSGCAFVKLLALLLMSAGLLAAAFLLAGHWAAAQGSDAGSMDAMSIDMDPFAAPANTATSLGSLEPCARINENDALDADEDSVDALQIDVVTGPLGIPASNPMVAYQFALRFPSGQIVVTGEDQDFLLAAIPGSILFDASDDLPHSDGTFYSSALDIGVDSNGGIVGLAESGPGVISRIEITATELAVAGVYELTLGDILYSDLQNNALGPDAINNALVAIGTECSTTPTEPTPTPPTPTLPPRESPVATPPPGTTPTPTPEATPPGTPVIIYDGVAPGDTGPSAQAPSPAALPAGGGFPTAEGSRGQAEAWLAIGITLLATAATAWYAGRRRAR